MIKFLAFLIYILFSFNVIHANEVEVIEIHKTKSLDQLVIENSNNTEIEEKKLEDIEENEVENLDNNTNDVEPNEDLDVELDILEDEKFWNTIDPSDLEYYLNNSQNIKSKLLHSELLNLLKDVSLDFEIQKNQKIFNIIINYLYNNGEISTAYKLIKKTDLSESKNLNYYIKIETDFLLSTYQLDKVCNLNEELDENTKIDNFYFTKIDIFCLILNDKILEADLQNSILLETETETDMFFQNLYLNITDKEDFSSSINIKNQNLVYLYSAMMRIAQIPLNMTQLNFDPKNLAIPIILNKATQIEIRLKAANKAYLNNILSVESLSALYQSVDFDSKQLDNPKKTIESLSDNIELIMAFYYQLINIQIFPTDRLNALLDFWDFAKSYNLQRIAYNLSLNTVESLELSQENANYGNDIAISYIYNKNYSKASDWISAYENIYNKDKKSTYSRILLDLYSSQSMDSVTTIISENLELLTDENYIVNKELLHIIISSFAKTNLNNLELNSDSIFDNRLMPSLTIINKIENNIKFKKNIDFILSIIISINNKEWKNIHPMHLKLILEGFNNFENEILIKELVLEIFADYKII